MANTIISKHIVIFTSHLQFSTLAFGNTAVPHFM